MVAILSAQCLHSRAEVVQDLEQAERAIIHFSLGLLLEIADGTGDELEHDRATHIVPQSIHVQLVIKKLTLLV